MDLVELLEDFLEEERLEREAEAKAKEEEAKTQTETIDTPITEGHSQTIEPR